MVRAADGHRTVVGTESLRIRSATADDAPALSRLLGQLGHPSDASEIPARLKNMEARLGTTVLVGEENGRVVSCVTVHLFYALHASEPTAWLTAVVVDEDVRGRGIGSAMIKRAEVWAIQHGALRIALTSALHRKEAHEFYKAREYEHTGVRLTKIFARSVTSAAARATVDPSPGNQPN